MEKSKKRKIIESIIEFSIIFLLIDGVISLIITLLNFKSNQLVTIETIVGKMFTPVVLLISFLLFLGVIGYFIYYSFKNGKNLFSLLKRVDRVDTDLYGNSRFMVPKEMKKTFGFKDGYHYCAFDFNNLHLRNEAHGYVINSYKKYGHLYALAASSMHSIIFGMTGSGKSSYFLGPTIQFNGQSRQKASMFILDLKGELYENNSKMLKDNRYRVIQINLRNIKDSFRLNPLDKIWEDYQEYLINGDIGILDRIGVEINDISSIISPEASKNADPFWSNGAKNSIAAAIWAMLEDSAFDKYEMTKEKFTLAQISNIFNIQPENMVRFFKNRPNNSKAKELASQLTASEKSEQTFASLCSTINSALSNFIDVGTKYLTSVSDFDLKDIIGQPTAIFLILDENNIQKYPLASLYLLQIYNFLSIEAAKASRNSLEKPFYFFLDEFCNFPKTNVCKWITISKSKNIFFCIIVQHYGQLKSIYGDNNTQTLLDQCKIKLFLSSDDDDVCEYIKKKLGTYTVYNRNVSVNERSLDGSYQGSTSLTKKDLVNSEELKKTKSGNGYLICTGEYPSKVTLIPFFDQELNNKHIIKIGKYIDETESCKDKKLEENFYDIEKRNELYQNPFDRKEESSKANPYKYRPQNNKKAKKENENYNPNIIPQSKPINELDRETLKKFGIIMDNLVDENDKVILEDMLAKRLEESDSNEESN